MFEFIAVAVMTFFTAVTGFFAILSCFFGGK